MLPDAPPPAGDDRTDQAGTTRPAAEGGYSSAETAESAEIVDTSPLVTGTVPGPAPRATGRGSRGTLLLGVAIAVVAVLSGSGLFASGYLLGQRQATQPGTPANEEAAFQPFWDVYAAIKDRYALGPVDQKTLIEGAIKGMVTAVGDPYSTYLTSDEFRSTLQDISGEFEGIGAEIGTVDAKGATSDCTTFGPDCQLDVVAPLEGSPAEKAGLKPGDIISKVDGASVVGLTPDQARDKVRGKKGTTVVLTIIRGTAAAVDVTITRDVVRQKEVITKDLSNGTVAYIRLTGFSDNGAADFVKAVQAALDRGETKIVVDLRGNPGGFVTAARTVASTFIADGPVFWEQDAQGKQTATEAGVPKPDGSLGKGIAIDSKIKVAVLIDKGSASASEIVAGALQDTKRATLFGETSYGKGTVQTWIELDNNAGGVKLTVAKWLTPDKRWIHKIGIVPDVPVTVPTTTPAGQDPVLDKAVQFLTGAATGALPSLLERAA
jgi:carboxyl-terminal processing protease